MDAKHVTAEQLKELAERYARERYPQGKGVVILVDTGGDTGYERLVVRRPGVTSASSSG